MTMKYNSAVPNLMYSFDAGGQTPAHNSSIAVQKASNKQALMNSLYGGNKNLLSNEKKILNKLNPHIINRLLKKRTLKLKKSLNNNKFMNLLKSKKHKSRNNKSRKYKSGKYKSRMNKFRMNTSGKYKSRKYKSRKYKSRKYKSRMNKKGGSGGGPIIVPTFSQDAGNIVSPYSDYNSQSAKFNALYLQSGANAMGDKAVLHSGGSSRYNNGFSFSAAGDFVSNMTDTL